jgi:hypothetical protein
LIVRGLSGTILLDIGVESGGQMGEEKKGNV